MTHQNLLQSVRHGMATLTLIKTEYWDRAGGGGNIGYDW